MEIADVTELSRRIHAREISCSELAERCLDRIARHDRDLRAFITVEDAGLRREAKEADADLAKGRDRGFLHGIPLGLKDLVFTKAVRTTAGSQIQREFVPSYDATLWRRLQHHGALLLGKLNLHEFAYGTTSANPHYGAVRNPWDLSRIPGGSSGGSAAAVAAGLSPASVGTDTGGSIRIPAACTGIVGLKPTYGRISLYGVMPLAHSLDHAGPMAASVRDTAALLDLMTGYDDEDPESVETPPSAAGFFPEASLRGTRVGVEEEFFFRDADPEILARTREVLAVLEGLGAQVQDLRVPILLEVPEAQDITISAEALAVHEQWLAERSALYGEDVRKRLEAGRGFSAADYARAARVRSIWRREAQRVFSRVDLWVTPTIPFLPPPVGAAEIIVQGKTQAVGRNLTRFTNPFNLAGFPAVSIPCGLSQDGLPIGVQLVGRPFAEARLLAAAAVLENAYPPHRPPLFP